MGQTSVASQIEPRKLTGLSRIDAGREKRKRRHEEKEKSKLILSVVDEKLY